ncbi:sugar kinase [Algoriphagus machipongonensis]|uniref:KHG/KDPG family aldolase/carbohydrate kinase, PfkB family n=1 Tax=Algoriphagus machipongonensis TaxID=388413 RepID=A3HSR2_9BACT|nr:sugar kinase [Algoriphagus machipongonensis]EAZ82880.1 KHG/KDPG family aldolase/carbohydrate kinase, PfkB family [Algoriphagus machipongonensis]
MKKIVSLGEVMLRLSPPSNERFFQTHQLQMEFGGSEANVGTALAFWEHHVIHLTTFPNHEIGKAAAACLRKNGIDTQFIQFEEGRIGVYFLEQGAIQRSSKILYDRADSVFTKVDYKNFNWEEILEGTDAVHWSGITPALSQECADFTLHVLKEANKRNITVFGDLNYRSNLWNYGKKPHEIMPNLMALTHVMIASDRDFNNCLNTEFDDFESAKAGAFNKFENLKYITKTNRTSISSSHNRISASLSSRENIYHSREYDLTPIVDRVGTGDAFAGGLIHGLLTNEPQFAIEFGMAAGALKHSVPGDVLLCSEEEILEIVAGESIGKIKR